MKRKEAEETLEKLKEIKDKLQNDIQLNRIPTKDILETVRYYFKISDIYYALELNITKFKQDNRLLGISSSSASEQKSTIYPLLSTLRLHNDTLPEEEHVDEKIIEELEKVYNEKNNKFESYLKMIDERLLMDIPIDQNLLKEIQGIIKE